MCHGIFQCKKKCVVAQKGLKNTNVCYIFSSSLESPADDKNICFKELVPAAADALSQTRWTFYRRLTLVSLPYTNAKTFS